MLWLTVNLQLHPFPWMSNGPSKWMPSYSKKDSVTTLKLPFDQNHPKASWSGIWVCLTAASSKNVLYGQWIFAVDAFHTALICHLPSAELCEESSSLFCPLCQLRGSAPLWLSGKAAGTLRMQAAGNGSIIHRYHTQEAEPSASVWHRMSCPMAIPSLRLRR